jgi:hypothetical protein
MRMQASGRRYGAQHPERYVKLWIHNLAAIPGQKAVIRKRAPRARDFTNRRYRYRGAVDEVERNHPPKAAWGRPA